MLQESESPHAFARPMLPALGEKKTQARYTFSSNSMVIHGPGGALDLSLYNFRPNDQQVQPGSSHQTLADDGAVVSGVDLPEEQQQIPGKKKMFKGPRRNSLLERIIEVLQDRRILEDSEDAHQLEDMKMPRLRKVLNIIFITAGVGFLLAVVIVILYTTFARYVA